MLLLMIERGMPIDIVLTADTGMEFPEMYDHLAKLDEYLYRERGIHLTMLRHPKGFEYMMFEEEKQKISSIENRQKLGVPLYGNGWPGVKVRKRLPPVHVGRQRAATAPAQPTSSRQGVICHNSW